MNGTAIPGSLSEGAAERSEAEGVSSDGSTGPMVTRKPLLALKFFPVTCIGVHSLSQPFGLPAPSEREPGNVPIQPGARETGRVRAIFIAPTEL